MAAAGLRACVDKHMEKMEGDEGGIAKWVQVYSVLRLSSAAGSTCTTSHSHIAPRDGTGTRGYQSWWGAARAVWRVEPAKHLERGPYRLDSLDRLEAPFPDRAPAAPTATDIAAASGRGPETIAGAFASGKSHVLCHYTPTSAARSVWATDHLVPVAVNFLTGRTETGH